MRNILLTLFNLTFLFCALVLGGKFVMGEFSSSQKEVPAQSVSAAPARRAPSTAGLKNTKLVSIPASVYKGINSNPAYKEYLLGNKKHVVQIMSPTCPYARALRGRVWQLLRGEYGEYYDEGVIKVQGSVELSCNGAEDCPTFWIFEHCSGLCLINPNTRQAVVYSSRDPQPVEAILERFKNW
ncbi:MAG: hypothetical protein Q4P84_05005 [Elusimicrobiales bacterium]|uniref:hypothetical protein n=1 Tax=Candidatus Avelusimicrobium sp. TaxID=3048833 RepID=UPI0026FFDBB3|nr:hypothetical protein [Elusimicrobiales bacterium]